MPQWDHFRQRLQSADLRYAALARIREFAVWLDLTIAEAPIAARKCYETLSEADAKAVFAGLLSYRFKLLRDAGINGTEDEIKTQLAGILDTVNAGGGSAEQRLTGRRLWNLMQITSIVTEAHPGVMQPVTAESVAADKAFTDSVGVVFRRLMAVMQATQAGASLSDNVAELTRISVDYQGLAAGAINAFQTNLVTGMLGSTYSFLGKNQALLKQADQARAAYQEAAVWYDKGGQPEQAAQCRRNAEDATRGLAGDLDHALRIGLELQLFGAAPGGGSSDDVLDRCKALAATLAATAASGDHFESLRLSEELAATLRRANLLDPQELGFDAAIDSWITNLPARYTGSDYFAAFHDVHLCYLRVLAARSQGTKDPRRAQEAYQLSLRDRGESDEFDVVSTSGLQRLRAENELDEWWSPYLPPGVKSGGTSNSGDAERDNALRQKLRAALELAWGKLREESGQRDASDPQDDLLTRAAQLEKQAATLNLSFYAAKAKMALAEVLINASRTKDALPILDEARHLIQGATPIAYGSYAGSEERGVYELILSLKARAQAMSGDLQGWSDTCEEAIAAIESQRYLVNSPERQNAFLGWRANFYVWGVAAARKLQHWDQMLERMELVKARSLIRNRLLPPTPELDVSALAVEFRDVCAQLQTATDAGLLQSLAGKRRQLWDLMSIARARERVAVEPPEISVANVQQALGEDEVLVAYFWQTNDVLLAVVMDRRNFKLERIEFSPDDLDLFREYVEAMQSLTSFNGEMDWMTARLGEVVLPPAVRALIDGKQRLIVSPHKTLHLLPLHAALWGEQFIGQRFAIRYVPNLSSLLLPLRSSQRSGVLSVGIRKFQTPPFDQNELPLAETEARRVHDLHAARGVSVDLLCGPEASRAGYTALQKKLPEYRCLHLATHGTSVFQGETLDHPMEARLMLEDGWLDGLEIAESRLEADLVVLSACSSGQRAVQGRGLQDLPGDDVFGLQSAFFSSGARAVLGSLWPLKDEQAYDLVLRFHSHFAAGEEADVSLQRAINEYLQENPRREIFYWAGFFLTTLGKQGEDKPCRS